MRPCPCVKQPQIPFVEEAGPCGEKAVAWGERLCLLCPAAWVGQHLNLTTLRARTVGSAHPCVVQGADPPW